MLAVREVVGGGDLRVAATSGYCTSTCAGDGVFWWEVVGRRRKHLVIALKVVTCIVLIDISSILLSGRLVHPHITSTNLLAVRIQGLSLTYRTDSKLPCLSTIAGLSILLADAFDLLCRSISCGLTPLVHVGSDQGHRMLRVADVLLVACTTVGDFDLVVRAFTALIVVVEEQGLRTSCSRHQESLLSPASLGTLARCGCGSLCSCHVFVVGEGGCAGRLPLLMLRGNLSKFQLPLLVLVHQPRVIHLMKERFCEELSMSNIEGILIVSVGVQSQLVAPIFLY